MSTKSPGRVKHTQSREAHACFVRGAARQAYGRTARKNLRWCQDRSLRVTSARSSAGENQEPTLEDVQSQMEAAVAREDYAEAARLRDLLDSRRGQCLLEVKRCNALFYEAFDRMDIKLMAQVWGEGAHVQCMHPGSANIMGADQVLASWNVIIEGGSAANPSGRMNIHCKVLNVHLADSMAFITCEEVMGTDEMNYGSLQATNVFEKQNGEWKLIHHQAGMSRN